MHYSIPSQSDIRRWQSYIEPGDEMESGGSGSSGSPTKRISRNLELLDAEEVLPPLPESTLARNLGLDLIVVVTKVRKPSGVPLT